MDIKKTKIIISVVSGILILVLIYLIVSSYAMIKKSKVVDITKVTNSSSTQWYEMDDDTLTEVMADGLDYLDEEERYKQEIALEEELERRYQEKMVQEEKENLETRLAQEENQKVESLKMDELMKLASVPRVLPTPELISSLSERALSRAMTQIGKPYVWGAVGPDTYDCSGLVLWAYNGEGYFNMPRTTRGQWTRGELIRTEQIKKGDLIYFLMNPLKSPVDHVGIYIGDGKMLNAPRPGAFVEIKAVPWDKVVSIRRHF